MFELYQLCVCDYKDKQKELRTISTFWYVSICLYRVYLVLGTVKDTENLERNECNKSCFCKCKTNSLRVCCDGRMARKRRFLTQFYTCGEENRNTEEGDVETLLKKRVKLGSWENRLGRTRVSVWIGVETRWHLSELLLGRGEFVLKALWYVRPWQQIPRISVGKEPWVWWESDRKQS